MIIAQLCYLYFEPFTFYISVFSVSLCYIFL